MVLMSVGIQVAHIPEPKEATKLTKTKKIIKIYVITIAVHNMLLCETYLAVI